MVDTTSETEMTNTSPIVPITNTFVTFCDSNVTIMNHLQMETTMKTLCDHKKQHLVHPYHDSWYETRPRRHLRSSESRFPWIPHVCTKNHGLSETGKIKLKKVVWFKLVATTGSCSKEPETPRETPLVCREP